MYYHLHHPTQSKRPSQEVYTSDQSGTILSHPVCKIKLPPSWGQFCPTQYGSLYFPTGWHSFVSSRWEVYTSLLGVTKLSHPVEKFKLPYWVGQFLPFQKWILAIPKRQNDIYHVQSQP